MAILKNTNITSTGHIQLPVGTTAQQSSDIITSFTSTGSTTWTCPAGITSVEVLVVAGGGGGGGDNGGGGGGGGVIYRPAFPVVPGTNYTVTVGAGGVGSASSVNTATNGANSVFGSLTAIGGGWGASGQAGLPGANPGGSGGGGAGEGIGAWNSGGAGTSGQGFSGGNSIWNRGGGAGGGGAGGPGESNDTFYGGNGSVGLPFDISGTLTYYGGGGGGANENNYNQVGGFGGIGGGGNGGMGNPTQGQAWDPQNGVSNTGGGGGGAGAQTSVTTLGGAGGSGIVIVRYNTTLGGSSAGSLRFNSSNSKSEIRDRGIWSSNFTKTTQTFTYTGSDQTFTVPQYVTSIEVHMWGAGGTAGGRSSGDTTSGAGGGGGSVVCYDLPVIPGETLTVRVGESPQITQTALGATTNSRGAVGAFGGGGAYGIGDGAGANGTYGGYGGGASSILRSGQFLAIAAGGGGAGGAGYSASVAQTGNPGTAAGNNYENITAAATLRGGTQTSGPSGVSFNASPGTNGGGGGGGGGSGSTSNTGSAQGATGGKNLVPYGGIGYAGNGQNPANTLSQFYANNAGQGGTPSIIQDTLIGGNHGRIVIRY